MSIIYMKILHSKLISILTHENFEDFVTGRHGMQSHTKSEISLDQSVRESMCLPSEEIHSQLKPNVEITLPSNKEPRNHNPPLHFSTEVNKKMTLPWWKWKNA